jgi:raffinose/stachyose/melibiose transport system permease protein
MAAAAAFASSRKNAAPGGLTTALVFLPPALVLFTLFIILPVAEAGWYSFFNWNGLGPLNRFIGFANYVQALSHSIFQRAFLNNLIIIAISLGVQLPLALGLAILLAERLSGAVAFRMIFFLPYILADVAAGLIWRFMFDGDYGPISYLMQWLGYPPLFLLADRQVAFSTVLTVIVWKYFGFHMMLYIAGLQSIDRNLYEAADMDGATPLQRFWHVTLPQLGPMIRISVFFSLVGSLQVFDLIVPLTGGGPLNSTHTMVSYLYQFGVGRMRVGFGSAVGVILFVLCVTVAFTYKRLFMRND